MILYGNHYGACYGVEPLRTARPSNPGLSSRHGFSRDPEVLLVITRVVPSVWRPDFNSNSFGNIWYGPEAQNTCANTEAAYLMLCEAFDFMAYRRVEWKCDSLNKRSRSAALRLGFTYEGLFRQHMIVKDRNRDTTWFSMLDTDWQDAIAAD